MTYHDDEPTYTTPELSNHEVQKRTRRWFARWRMVFVELDDGSCWRWNPEAHRYEYAPHANDYTDPGEL